MGTKHTNNLRNILPFENLGQEVEGERILKFHQVKVRREGKGEGEEGEEGKGKDGEYLSTVWSSLK